MTTTELRTPPELPPDLATEMRIAAKAAEPYPLYRRVHREFPVAYYRHAVNLFRYDDVATLLRHPDVSNDDRRSGLHQSLVAENKLTPDYLSQVDDQSFLHRDPPEHTRLRKLVTHAFTARRVAALQPLVQRTVDEAITAVADKGSIELVADLAYPLPIAVICELLGIPAEDRPFVASWPRTQLCCTFESGSIGAVKQIGDDTTRQAEADRLQRQLTDYFALLIESRRKDPGEDLISALLAAEEQGDRLSVAEVNATLRLLFIAGYENVVNLIGHGVLALLRHPDQWAALRNDPTLAASAVDEVLRYDSPFQFLPVRIAMADLAIGGYRIPRGSLVRSWLATANRDPARFTDPDRFDIRRADNHHFAFGSGIHACLGGPLARMQAEVVFTTLTRRLVDPRLAVDPPQYRTDVVRSLAELPVVMSGVRGAA